MWFRLGFDRTRAAVVPTCPEDEMPRGAEVQPRRDSATADVFKASRRSRHHKNFPFSLLDGAGAGGGWGAGAGARSLATAPAKRVRLRPSAGDGAAANKSEAKAKLKKS